MKTTSKLYYFLLIALLALGLMACTTSDDPDTAEGENEPTTVSEEPAVNTDEPVTITFGVNNWERGQYEQLLEAFNEEYPNINIEFVSIDEIFGDAYSGNNPSQEYESQTLMLARRVDTMSWYLYQPDVKDGTLLNLYPFIESDPEFPRDDYYPGMIDQYEWDGGLWALPSQANFALMFFNKDLFDTAGVPYPEPGWTWDDLLAKAQALTNKSENQYGFSNQFTGPDLFVQTQVGPLFNFDVEPPTARLTDPEVIEAFEWYTDLFFVHEVAPYAAPPQSEDDFAAYDEIYQLIDQGKVGIWPEYSDAWNWRKEQMNIGVAPFPVSADNQQSTPIMGFSGSLAISAGTRHPEAAWAWVKFLTSQQVNNQPQSSMLPARRSVAEANGVWGNFDEEFATAMRFAVDHAFSPSFPPYGAEGLYQNIEAVMAGDKEVADALADAQTQFEQAAEEQLETQAEATPIPEFTVAEPPSTQIGEDEVVINFIVGGGDPAIYRQIAKEYNEQTAGVFVKVSEPNYYNNENQDYTMRTLTQGADCFQWWNAPTSEEDLAIVLPLQPFLDADPELDESDFFAGVLNQFRNQGQIIGLPSEVQIRLMNYNKRLFDAAGVDYPEVDWTIDDFLEKAVALTEGDDPETKIYGFAPDVYEFGDMMAFMERQGVVLVNQNQDPPNVNFGGEDVTAAMRWFTNLTTEYDVKPVFDFDPQRGFGPGQDPYGERQTLIDNDRVAMWTGEGFIIQYGPDGQPLAEQDNAHIGYVPYPQGPSGGSGFDNASGYFISAETQSRQACWAWIKHLTSEAGATPYGVPARISTASSPETAQRMGAEKAAVLVASLEQSTQGSMMNQLYAQASWLGPATFWFQKAYDSVVAGDETVEDALTDAQSKADEYRQCIIDNEYFGNDYMQWEECLKEVDPEFGNY